MDPGLKVAVDIIYAPDDASSMTVHSSAGFLGALLVTRIASSALTAVITSVGRLQV